MYINTITPPPYEIEGLRYWWPFNNEYKDQNIAIDTYGTSPFNGAKEEIVTDDGLYSPNIAGGNDGWQCAINLTGCEPSTSLVWLKSSGGRSRGVIGYTPIGSALFFALLVENGRFSSSIGPINPVYYGTIFPNQLLFDDINYPSNQWKQIGFLYYPNGSMTLIQNGMIMSTNPTNGTGDASNPIRIFFQGWGVCNSECYYKDLRIYNRHLTPEEINYIYRKGPYL